MWFGFSKLCITSFFQNYFDENTQTIVNQTNRSREKDELCTEKVFFLFLDQNICCGYSKEPSHWDGYFEHPKHIIKLISKKTFTILWATFLYTQTQVLQIINEWKTHQVKLNVFMTIQTCSTQWILAKMMTKKLSIPLIWIVVHLVTFHHSEW